MLKHQSPAASNLVSKEFFQKVQIDEALPVPLDKAVGFHDLFVPRVSFLPFLHKDFLDQIKHIDLGKALATVNLSGQISSY